MFLLYLEKKSRLPDCPANNSLLVLAPTATAASRCILARAYGSSHDMDHCPAEGPPPAEPRHAAANYVFFLPIPTGRCGRGIRDQINAMHAVNRRDALLGRWLAPPTYIGVVRNPNFRGLCAAAETKLLGQPMLGREVKVAPDALGRDTRVADHAELAVEIGIATVARVTDVILQYRYLATASCIASRE